MFLNVSQLVLFTGNGLLWQEVLPAMPRCSTCREIRGHKRFSGNERKKGRPTCKECKKTKPGRSLDEQSGKAYPVEQATNGPGSSLVSNAGGAQGPQAPTWACLPGANLAMPQMPALFPQGHKDHGGGGHHRGGDFHGGGGYSGAHGHGGGFGDSRTNNQMRLPPERLQAQIDNMNPTVVPSLPPTLYCLVHGPSPVCDAFIAFAFMGPPSAFYTAHSAHQRANRRLTGD